MFQIIKYSVFFIVEQVTVALNKVCRLHKLNLLRTHTHSVATHYLTIRLITQAKSQETVFFFYSRFISYIVQVQS